MDRLAGDAERRGKLFLCDASAWSQFAGADGIEQLAIDPIGEVWGSVDALQDGHKLSNTVYSIRKAVYAHRSNEHYFLFSER